jgi:hypothetical protein
MTKLDWAINKSLENFAEFGGLFYTRRQLYYEICRFLRSPKGLDYQTAGVLFGLGSAVSLALAMRKKTGLAAGFFAVNALGTGALTWLRKTPHNLLPPFSLEEFEQVFENYLQKREHPKGLIETLSSVPKTVGYPSDLTLYGLPHLLICQSGEIAQMLRANRFHLETPCAVLSLCQATPLEVMFLEMLANAPEPKVFYFHDAAKSSYAIIPDLRKRLLLPESISLQIIGLRPLHAQRLHLFVQTDENTENVSLENFEYLNEDEKQWLQAGWQAEVASVNPVRLLRVLRRIILNLPSVSTNWELQLPKRETGFMT